MPWTVKIFPDSLHRVAVSYRAPDAGYTKISRQFAYAPVRYEKALSDNKLKVNTIRSLISAATLRRLLNSTENILRRGPNYYCLMDLASGSELTTPSPHPLLLDITYMLHAHKMHTRKLINNTN